MRIVLKTIGVIGVVLVVLIPMAVVLGAMTSSGYKIPSDSINFGGADGQSASYKGQDTFGEVGTGDSVSASYALHAGYQQMLQSYIAISSSGNQVMPSIGGLGGEASVSSTTWTVTTDNAAGYQISVAASTTPALKGLSGGSYFEDYATTTTPDYSFVVGSTKSYFGYTPEGVDIISRYKDNGSTACNTGSNSTPDKCWSGFYTSPIAVAQGFGPNQPNGATTTLKYRAEVGSAKIQDSGTYSATVTVTAITL